MSTGPVSIIAKWSAVWARLVRDCKDCVSAKHQSNHHMMDEHGTWTSKPNNITSDGQNHTPLYTLRVHTGVCWATNTSGVLQQTSANPKQPHVTLEWPDCYCFTGHFFRGINIISDPAVYRKRKKKKKKKKRTQWGVTSARQLGPKPIKLASNKIWIKCKGRLAWACTSHAHNTIDPLRLFSTWLFDLLSTAGCSVQST